MPTAIKQPPLTSAKFLSAQRRVLKGIRDLCETIEELPTRAATDARSMRRLFDELVTFDAMVSQFASRLQPLQQTKEITTMTDHDIDLVITKISNRNRSAGGSWVQGKINDEYRFDALVFADHAEQASFELNGSKISKLWVQRIKDRKVMFNFDRGLDVPAATTEIQVVVDFLCGGLSDLVFDN